MPSTWTLEQGIYFRLANDKIEEIHNAIIGVDLNFQQFVPEYDAIKREAIGTRKRHETDEEIALLRQVLAEENFIQTRRPFYRLYPGVTEALTRLGIEKLKVSKIHPPVNPLSLEFPVDRPLIAGDRKIVNILFMEFEDADSLFIEYRSHVDTFGVVLFPRKYEQIMQLLDTMAGSDRETTMTVLQIVFGVCMIPQSDTDLITPRVLNRDKEKFEATGDMKLVERARRNGVFGYDVGRDIPALEEMEVLRQQRGEPGRKSPHWRIGHCRICRTEEGHPDSVVWIKETFVNKNLLKEVPTGFYGKEEET